MDGGRRLPPISSSGGHLPSQVPSRSSLGTRRKRGGHRSLEGPGARGRRRGHTRHLRGRPTPLLPSLFLQKDVVERRVIRKPETMRVLRQKGRQSPMRGFQQCVKIRVQAGQCRTQIRRRDHPAFLLNKLRDPLYHRLDVGGG